MEIEIFSAANCHYCDLTKKLLDERGLSYSEHCIDRDQSSRQELARRLPHARNLPQVFIDGEHIGSYEDLLVLARDGGLEQET